MTEAIATVTTAVRSLPRQSLLSSVARRDVPTPPLVEESCELCAASIVNDHLHLLDLGDRSVRCVCRACAILFDHREAGGGKLRRIPDGRWRLPSGSGVDDAWRSLGIPVDLAFIVVDSDSNVLAHYPSPVGATDELLDADVWSQLVVDQPKLGRLEPDVQAVLLRRNEGTNQRWIVPIDDCYRMVAVMGQYWEGFTGGTAVWAALDELFADIDRQART